MTTFYFIVIVLLLAVLCVYGQARDQGAPKLNPFHFPIDLKEGSRARVLCSAYLGSPPLHFIWMKDGKELLSDSFTSINLIDPMTSSLTLEPLKLTHIGNYSCIVKNDFGSDSFISSLFVTAPPRWIYEPQNAKVSKGGHAVINCQASGSPLPQITWKKLGASAETSLLHTASFRVVSNNSIVVDKAGKLDAGLYLCEATNGIGSKLSKVVELSVYVPPHVRRLLDFQNVERGDDAVLKCIIEGDEPLTVVWMKDKTLISDLPELFARSSYEIEAVGNQTSTALLTLTNIENQDGGLFSCMVKNPFGSGQADVKLIVLERPNAPSLLEITDIWSRSARITWSPPSFNGNSPVNAYIIEYWSTSGGHKNHTTSSSSTSTILRDLTPSSTYFFYIWSRNSVGFSQPSSQMQFTTADEEPSAPPVDVRIEEIGATFVKLSWQPPSSHHWNGDLQGFYVGYKLTKSRLSTPYTYYTTPLENGTHFMLLRGLIKYSEYSIVVAAYNKIGMGPSSEQIIFRTRNFEAPLHPLLTIKSVTPTSLQLHWQLKHDSSNEVTGYTVYFRKHHEGWQKFSVSNPLQTTHTLTNLEDHQVYQVYIVANSPFGSSEPSEVKTIQTSAWTMTTTEATKQYDQTNDVMNQTLYIVLPVSIAAVVIVVVIAVACLYVYSKRPPVTPVPYEDFLRDKSFSYTATVPRRRDLPPSPQIGTELLKYSPSTSLSYTIPLTQPYLEEEEPIYESVVDEIKSVIQQRGMNMQINPGGSILV